MISYKVYYDYHEGTKAPIWIVLNVRNQIIDWDHKTLTIAVQAPFDMHPAEEFDQDAMNVTILIDDLLLTTSENVFGINLTNVEHRLNLHGVDRTEVDNFVIQVADLEDMLQFTL
ncbi:hypothetical protein ABC345_00870 [Shouchella sp. 1P09AA]|uniref:Uncharacterized protein n=1 Tax=Alkalicoccobacillus plakortidis TaxID=444060 RepID=A0A9D5HXN7_9BACI|nr:MULTISPECIES: hypothetical protein [Bacillaceae]KQL56959.1 hypothetical protein AN965_10875 [Alkalicoccobacillus plakortidis]